MYWQGRPDILSSLLPIYCCQHIAKSHFQSLQLLTFFLLEEFLWQKSLSAKLQLFYLNFSFNVWRLYSLSLSLSLSLYVFLLHIHLLSIIIHNAIPRGVDLFMLVHLYSTKECVTFCVCPLPVVPPICGTWLAIYIECLRRYHYL